MIKSWLALAAQAAAVAVLIGLIGLSGKLAGIPWLFASFGPSVALQLTKPHLPMSRAWNVWLGHLIAIGSGLAAVYATGADGVPAFASGQPLSLLRGASDIACPEFRISPVRPATGLGDRRLVPGRLVGCRRLYRTGVYREQRLEHGANSDRG